MLDKIWNTIQNSTLLKLLFGLAFAVAYIVTEPTLSNTYALYCTYRMQTVVILLNYGLLAMTWLIAALRLLELRRAKIRLDIGAILPYVALYLGFLIATLANPETGSLDRWTDTFFYSMIPLLMAFLFFSLDGGREYYISVIATAYLILALLNILFYFFPQLYLGEAKDWREEFFLGFKNKAGWSLMLGAFFILMDWKLNRQKWKMVLYFVALIVNVRLVWCITAVLGTAILALYCILPFVRRWVQKWDFLVFTAIILVLFCCLMFFQDYTVKLDPVVLFIEEVLHKKSNMSGRLPLWNLGVPIVMQRPWLGVGAQLHPGFILMADEYGVWSMYHAHNELLQTWYEGGLLTVFLAIGMLAYAAKRFRRCKDRSLCGICKLMLFIILFMELSDNMPYYLWYIPALMTHISVMLCDPVWTNAEHTPEKENPETPQDVLAELNAR